MLTETNDLFILQLPLTMNFKTNLTKEWLELKRSKNKFFIQNLSVKFSEAEI